MWVCCLSLLFPTDIRHWTIQHEPCRPTAWGPLIDNAHRCHRAIKLTVQGDAASTTDNPAPIMPRYCAEHVFVVLYRARWNLTMSIWPCPLGQGQIWHHQWFIHIGFPIGGSYNWHAYLVQINCYIWFKTDNVQFDLDLCVKVKFDITNEFFIKGSYWWLIHLECISRSEKLIVAIWVWQCLIWPWPLGQGQIWHHQGIIHMVSYWWSIHLECYIAHIRSYRWFKLNTMYFNGKGLIIIMVKLFCW